MSDSQMPEVNEPDATLEGFELVFYSGSLKDDIRHMRERILRDEMKLLADSGITSEDDQAGTHLCIYHDGRLVGAALGVKAEESSVPARAGIPAERWKDTYYATRLMVAPEYRKRGLATLLVYTVLRETRILDRSVTVFFAEGDPLPSRLTRPAQPVQSVPPLTFTGHSGHTYELRLMQADVSYGMYLCWQHLRGTLREFVADRLLADEVVRTVLRHTARFYENPWFQAVATGTLTRGQYIKFLANNHQFVRWTTRILARVAGLAENADLRNHYLRHLQGEIDHEKIIERDLEYLGADVDYIREHMFPCVDIGHFMGVQESIVGFRADPTLLLAVPIAIESLTAHLDPRFLHNLESCVRGWGYDNPSKATAYLRSHIPIDGGDDGHWAATAQTIRKFLKTEPDTQKFVGVVRMVIVALDRALRSYVEYPDLT